MEKKCVGCGIKLQTTDPTNPGFVPESVFKRGQYVCQRCFRIVNYGDIGQIQTQSQIGYRQILMRTKRKDSLIVLVIDVFNIHSSLIHELLSYIINNRVLVIANKIDLLPLSTPVEKVIDYIKMMLAPYKMKILDILACAGEKNYNVDEIYDKINLLRNGKSVYFVGAANVGKSTIINRLLKNYTNQTSKFITTSRYPGTTLDLIAIPLDESSNIYDTPGMVNKESMLSHVDKSAFRYILPRTRIKPISYQIDPGQTILLGGLARFDYLKGVGKLSVVIYLSQDIKVSRMKLSNADNNFKAAIASAIPFHQFSSIDDFETFPFKVNLESKKDISICGFALISIHGNSEYELKIYAPKGVSVTIEDSLV